MSTTVHIYEIIDSKGITRFEKAIRANNLTSLRLMHVNRGLPWTYKTHIYCHGTKPNPSELWGTLLCARLCALAAYTGNLEMLKWLRDNECPWSASTCTFAAQNGNLEVLQWARGQNCPWDEHTYKSAIKNGHTNVAEWAHVNGCGGKTVQTKKKYPNKSVKNAMLFCRIMWAENKKFRAKYVTNDYMKILNHLSGVRHKPEGSYERHLAEGEAVWRKCLTNKEKSAVQGEYLHWKEKAFRESTA